MVFSATHEYVPLDVFVSRDILNMPFEVCPSGSPLWKNLYILAGGLAIVLQMSESDPLIIIFFDPVDVFKVVLYGLSEKERRFLYIKLYRLIIYGVLMTSSFCGPSYKNP